MQTKVLKVVIQIWMVETSFKNSAWFLHWYLWILLIRVVAELLSSNLYLALWHMFFYVFFLSALLRDCSLCWDYWNGMMTPTLEAALLSSSRAGADLGRMSVISLSFCSFLYNRVYFRRLKLYVGDFIYSKKRSQSRRKAVTCLKWACALILRERAMKNEPKETYSIPLYEKDTK